MEQAKAKTPVFTEKTLERLLCLACFVSLPLIGLFALTMGMSWLTTGGIQTNVNETGDLVTVLLSFSLPMVLALAAAPVAVKCLAQKRSLKDLGLAPQRSLGNGIACAVMAALSVVLAVVLGSKEGLEASAWTVLIHFFFVALSEEVMLRGVVHDELSALTKNPWLLCLANGLIFAFVYHSNSDFWSNLLIRVPMGAGLCLVRMKSKSLYPAIMLHWLYNMFVTTI